MGTDGGGRGAGWGGGVCRRLLQGQAVRARSSSALQLALQWCELSAPSKASGATLCTPHWAALSDRCLYTPDLACLK